MTWRLLDTGPRTAAENMALDAVLLERCAAGTSRPTLRFMRFSPPAVLVGAYQQVEDEVRTGWCAEHGIDVGRRITGGGAILLDSTQVGWEVVCRWEDLGASRPTQDLFERMSLPLVMALRDLGLRASFRPRNDVEVDGRKISGTGGTEHGPALLVQGTLLVDLDVETMARALKVPVEKLARRELESMKERVTWLGREIPRPPALHEIQALIRSKAELVFGIDLEPGTLSAGELSALEARVPEFSSEAWILGRARRGSEEVRGLLTTGGGVLRPVVKVDPGRTRIEAIVLDGDFFASPRRGIPDLEARLKGAPVKEVSSIVDRSFEDGTVSIRGVSAQDVARAIGEALDRKAIVGMGMSTSQANSTFPVGLSLARMASLVPTHVLLPYCAKPVDCPNRREDACDGCGRCTVGEAYAAAQAAGLRVHTVTSFDHLLGMLGRMRDAGARAFLGSCCEAFYVKHRAEMEEAGVPGILVDVLGSESCFDLGKASWAARGEYEGRTDLDAGHLKALIGACRRAGGVAA